jgi:hypothetical protein
MNNLKINITQEYIKEATRNFTVFAEALTARGYNPSLLGPTFVATLASTEGWVVSTSEYTEIVETPDGLNLRAEYVINGKKFDEGRCTDTDFRAAVLPLLFKVTAEAMVGDAEIYSAE